MLASTIPVSILGVQFAMRVFPFWTPAQYSEYCYPFPEVSFARTDKRYLSPSRGYAVWERDRGRLGVDELHSKGTRVSRIIQPLNALLTRTGAKTTTRQKHCSRLALRGSRPVVRSRSNLYVSR